ncbi:MAG: hypothetical protein AVO35_09920 [Candidatus Aegiribacteria sp. MLS_C]|nr:MAG: hypothetical protein AVO35_09920 [Candidatus Aegiribacteria sp. MLS_C]
MRSDRKVRGEHEISGEKLRENNDGAGSPFRVRNRFASGAGRMIDREITEAVRKALQGGASAVENELIAAYGAGC